LLQANEALRAQLAKRSMLLAERDSHIAERDARIADLEAELELLANELKLTARERELETGLSFLPRTETEIRGESAAS